jgi:hypothetical protein
MSTVSRKTYKEAIRRFLFPAAALFGRSKSSRRQPLLDIRDKYRAAGMPWPPKVRDIAIWAIEEGLWEPPTELAISKCTADMSKALKEEHHTDLQGRKGVRTNIAALLPYFDEDHNEKQGWFWDDIRTCSEDHLLAAFKQHREGVISDAKSLQRQMDSANDNNPNLAGRPIRMLWDLSEEVADDDASAAPAKPR